MTFDQVNPKTGKVKEYKNSAEWLKDVEEATAKPIEKKPEVKTFADAMKRYNEELGIRDPVAEKEAAVAELIERKVAEGVSSALERQQAEKAQQAQKAEKVSQSPWPIIQKHSAQPRYKFYDNQEGCGCKAEGHKPAAKPAIHSRRGIGPIMSAQRTRPEIEHNGTTYRIYGVRAPQQQPQ